MKLNNISCSGYSAGERFQATLHNTTPEAIRALDAANLVVRADDGSAVETYTIYGRLYSVRHIIADDTYEVEFERVPETEKLAAQASTAMKGAEELSALVFVCLAQNEAFDDATVEEHKELFSEWDENWTGRAGSIVKEGGVLYRSIHTVGAGQNTRPSANPSMWTRIGGAEEACHEWSQPLGAQDAYAKGDIVSYGGKHYVSTADNNVWQPGIYGWDETEE